MDLVSRFVRQQPVYGISKYGDLDPLLGKGWHLRMLNKGGDFCYCAKESVQFYLHRKKSMEEVDQDGKGIFRWWVLFNF